MFNLSNELTIFANTFASKDAPPTNAPSILSSLKKVSALFSLTLPPYKTFGVILFADADCTTSFINSWIAFISFSSGVLPLPIAHIGS